VIQGHRTGESIDAPFAGRVGRHSSLRGEGLHGGEVDYRSSSALSHLRYSVSRGEVDPLQVHVDDLVPHLFFGLDDGPVTLHTGAVHQDVHATIGLACEIHQLLHVGRRSHVRPHPANFEALLAQRCDCLFYLLLAVAADNYRGAFSRQLPGHRPADAPSAAGDDRYLP
jgi:hypothetical protein